MAVSTRLQVVAIAEASCCVCLFLGTADWSVMMVRDEERTQPRKHAAPGHTYTASQSVRSSMHTDRRLLRDTPGLVSDVFKPPALSYAWRKAGLETPRNTAQPSSASFSQANLQALQSRDSGQLPGTKIMATVGPATESVDVLSDLLRAGLRCVRLDISCSRGAGVHDCSSLCRRNRNGSDEFLAQMLIGLFLRNDLCLHRFGVVCSLLRERPGESLV